MEIAGTKLGSRKGGGRERENCEKNKREGERIGGQGIEGE